MNLYDLRITGGQDGVRYAAKLLSRFSYLANGVSGSDFKPTDQHLEVAKLLRRAHADAARRSSAPSRKDVAAFNELLRRHRPGRW